MELSADDYSVSSIMSMFSRRLIKVAPNQKINKVFSKIICVIDVDKFFMVKNPV